MLLLVALLEACAPFTPLVISGSLESPPVLLEVAFLDELALSFQFSKEVQSADAWKAEYPDGQSHLLPLEILGSRVLARLPKPIEAGESAQITGTVLNQKGDSLYFARPLYGVNTDLPGLRINEIRVVHSSARPEAIEILVLHAGKLSGIQLVVGMPGPDARVVRFPPVPVETGDFITVIFRVDEALIQGDYSGHGFPLPAGVPDSGAKVQLLAPGGLSDAAELILLYQSPDLGRAMDGVFYSNKSWDPENRYFGYGTKASLEKAVFFATLDLGYRVQTDPPKPEDFVGIIGTTATRTLNREETKEPRWYLCATGKDSIGRVNNQDRYQP